MCFLLLVIFVDMVEYAIAIKDEIETENEDLDL